MHGLINRALQAFLLDTYGSGLWSEVAASAQLGFDGFEAMLIYDAALTDAVLAAASARLGKPSEELLEDLGTYLVSSPSMARLRRLLRYAGDSFIDFLHSLDDLPERARLAVPDLEMPRLVLRECGGGFYLLECGASPAGMVHVTIGALRAMADDYGALVFLELRGETCGPEAPAPCHVVEIEVLSVDFAEGRSFQLSAGAA